MKLFCRPLRRLANKSRHFSAAESVPILSDIKRSVPIGIEKKKKDPFMKNVFLGKFNEDFLTYPEIKELDLLTELSYKSNLVMNSLRQEQNLNVIEDKTRFLAKSGFLGSQEIPNDYGGLDLRASELVAITENIRLSPSLSLSLETQKSLIIPTLFKYATAEMKKKFIPRILKGEILGAYALTEDNCYDPFTINTNYQVVDSNYIINGEKRWVCNADKADFFIVFAKSYKKSQDSKNISSVFIVEKDSNIQIIPENASDTNEFAFSKIIFKEINIPTSNIIGVPDDGFKIAMERLKTPKFFLSTCILSYLKEILAETAKRINLRKMSPNSFYNLEREQYILSKLAVLTYALESMMYFIAGNMDLYDVDMSLESALLYVCSYEQGLQGIGMCVDLLGPTASDTSLSFDKKLNDLRWLATGPNKIDIHTIFGALTGLEHTVQIVGDDIKKSRNPFDFPFFIMKQILEERSHGTDNPKLTLNLYLNLHPSLKTSAELLEYCVFRFKYVVQQILIRHGGEIRNRQVDLNRIFQIATDIFAMTSVLSRSSRAYCTGLQHCDKEVQFAKAFCVDACSRTKKTVQEILDGGLHNNDVLYLEISDDVLEKSIYFLEHPLKRNIV